MKKNLTWPEIILQIATAIQKSSDIYIHNSKDTKAQIDIFKAEIENFADPGWRKHMQNIKEIIGDDARV